MSHWFCMLGQAISGEEASRLREYALSLGIEAGAAIEPVSTWSAARAVITSPEWDRRYHEAEQAEKLRLVATAGSRAGLSELSELQSRTLAQSEAIHGAAAVAAARLGCADLGLIGAAAGSACEALHLALLAELAGAHELHPFSLKRAVFEAGHWPLGGVGGRYYVF